MKCINLTQKALEVISKSSAVHWFCPDCESENPVNELKELRVLKDNLSAVSAKLDLISAKVDANSKNISEIRQSRPIENASANSLNEAVSVTLNEISEQEGRKSNLCFWPHPGGRDK